MPNSRNPHPGGKHPVFLLLIRHYQHFTKHQGRHFTEGAIRSADYLLRGKQIDFIHNFPLRDIQEN
jgi:hypothetical protein